MNKKVRNETVELSIEALTPHPLQAELYRPRADWEIADLSKELEENGQLEPVEVTPDHVIISGHSRVEAARRLGWTTIACWVRHDLAEAGPEAIVERLIQANLCGRQLTKLDIARQYLALKQVARRRRGRRANLCNVRTDLRDLLAERFQTSGRTLDRLLQVLQLPVVLQLAFDRGELPLLQATKIAVLDRRLQAEIANEVEQGQPVKQVMSRYLPKNMANEREPAIGALGRIIEFLKRQQEELEPHVSEIRSGLFGSQLNDLRQARTFLDRLIAQLESNREQTQKALREVSTEEGAAEAAG